MKRVGFVFGLYFSIVKKVPVPQFTFSKKVHAPSFCFSKEVLAPSFFFQIKTLSYHFSSQKKSLPPPHLSCRGVIRSFLDDPFLVSNSLQVNSHPLHFAPFNFSPPCVKVLIRTLRGENKRQPKFER